MKKKHRKDYNHGKQGWVGGNPRWNSKGKDRGNLTHKNRAAAKKLIVRLIDKGLSEL